MSKVFIRMLLLITMLSLFLCHAALAQWSEPFGQSFADTFQLTSLSDRIVVCSAAADDKLYAMTKRGFVYSYDISENQYETVAQVTAWPSIDYDVPFAVQNAEAKKAMEDAVTDLLVDDKNTLYGFNKMTGTIGVIDADGVHWQDVKMDTSVFFEPGSNYPVHVLNQPQITGSHLEGWIVTDMEGEPSIKYVLFSLMDGTCSSFDLDGAFRLCRISDNELLALVMNNHQSISLTVYDKAGQRLREHEAALPSIEIGQNMMMIDLRDLLGPLAYDVSTDSLYLIDDTRLYKSVDGKPFEIVSADVPWLPPLAYSKLQTVNGNGLIMDGQWLWQ